MKDFNSDEAASVKSPSSGPAPTMTPAERRARSEKRQAALTATLKARLSPTAFATVESIPTKYRGKALKALTRQASHRVVVEAKCEECVGYENVAAEVGGCKAVTCPLWAYRPYQAQSEKS